MLLMSVQDEREAQVLPVRFLEARDGGREVRFAILDSSGPAKLSEIVVSSMALGTCMYDMHSLTASLAEQALETLEFFHQLPRIVDEHARHKRVTSLELLSHYYVRITSTLMQLEEKNPTESEGPHPNRGRSR